VLKAKGVGTLAERIIQLAREHNIPIKEDPDLVELLVQLDLEQEIPPELYKVVAEILAFVYSLETQQMRK
jgi:flagellar biosynthesis protein